MPIIVIILFAFWPVACLPIVLGEIYRGKRYAVILLVVFFALISSFYIPYGDQYRYWLDFHEIEYFSDFFETDEAYRRISVPFVLLYVVKKIGGHFEFVRMICVLLSFSVCYWVYFRWKNFACFPAQKEETNSIVNLFDIFIILISIPFLVICMGYRQGSGTCLALAGIYMSMIERRYKMAAFFIISAICFHLSFLIVPLVIFIGCRSDLRWRSVVWMIVAILFGVSVIDFAFSLFVDILPSKLSFLSAYFSQEGPWRDYTETRNSYRNFADSAAKIFLFFVGVLLFKVKESFVILRRNEILERVSSFYNVSLVLFFVWCLAFSFQAVAVRISYLLTLLVAFMIVFARTIGAIHHRMVVVIMSVMCLCAIYGLREYVHLFRHLDYSSLLTSSVREYLTKTYDESYVETNVTSTGEFFDEPN